MVTVFALFSNLDDAHIIFLLFLLKFFETDIACACTFVSICVVLMSFISESFRMCIIIDCGVATINSPAWSPVISSMATGHTCCNNVLHPSMVGYAALALINIESGLSSEKYT